MTANSGNPERRTILVHLNVEAPADDRRDAGEIGAAIIDQLGLANTWRPGTRDLVFHVALAEETGPQIAPTGHVVGAVYRSSYWGGNYRVLGAHGDHGVRVECISPGNGAHQVVGERWTHCTALSVSFDERLQSAAWVGRVDGTFGPLGFPTVETAEHYLAVVIAEDDPSGVEQGHYYVDGDVG